MGKKFLTNTYFEKLDRLNTYVVLAFFSPGPFSRQPAGTTRRFPSGLNDRRRKNDFRVSSRNIRKAFGFSLALLFVLGMDSLLIL